MSVFGNTARLYATVPVSGALLPAIDVMGGRTPDPSWSRRPGRPRRSWVDQVRDDAGISYQHCGPQRLPVGMERRGGLRPGDNDDVTDDGR